MKKTALLIIDVQKGLDDPANGKRNNPNAESNIVLLLAEWRKRSLPVIHVKHNSTEPNSTLRPDAPGNKIKDNVKPISNEILFEKTVNSAFIGTGLESYLTSKGIEDLVVVGLTTDQCVSSSVRMASNLGFNVWLVDDATATFERESYDGKYFSADQMHEINLASLNDEFCSVIKTADVFTNTLK